MSASCFLLSSRPFLSDLYSPIDTTGELKRCPRASFTDFRTWPFRSRVFLQVSRNDVDVRSLSLALRRSVRIASTAKNSSSSVKTPALSRLGQSYLGWRLHRC